MLTTYRTADKAILESMGDGLITLCLPTQQNIDDLEHQCDRWQDDGSVVRFISDLELVEACWDRRLRDDGSILFSCTAPEKDWTVVMERRPW